MIERGKEKGFHRMVIAGAGAAGISAAICAAKRGLQVDLIEASSAPGGTVVGGMIHTLAGFLNTDGQLIESEICHDLCGRLGNSMQKRKMGKFWVLQIEPEIYGHTMVTWLKEISSIRFHPHSKISALELNADGIQSAQVTGPLKWTLPGEGAAFVDATGVGELALLAGQARPDKGDSFAISFRFQVPGLSCSDRAVRAALKLEIENIWPFQNSSIWLDSGFAKEEFFLKVNFPGPEQFAKDFAARIQKTLPKILNEVPRLRSFTSLQVSQLVQRSGSRLKSKPPPASLEKQRTFEVAWPFELWQGPHVELQIPLEMPLRLSENFLHAADVENLFAAGKCAGIPDKEMSAARVVGGCWAMGEQVAKITTRANQ